MQHLLLPVALGKLASTIVESVQLFWKTQTSGIISDLGIRVVELVKKSQWRRRRYNPFFNKFRSRRSRREEEKETSWVWSRGCEVLLHALHRLRPGGVRGLPRDGGAGAQPPAPRPPNPGGLGCKVDAIVFRVRFWTNFRQHLLNFGYFWHSDVSNLFN